MHQVAEPMDDDDDVAGGGGLGSFGRLQTAAQAGALVLGPPTAEWDEDIGAGPPQTGPCRGRRAAPPTSARLR